MKFRPAEAPWFSIGPVWISTSLVDGQVPITLCPSAKAPEGRPKIEKGKQMDKEKIAIERLKAASEMSLAYYKQPLVACLSGGDEDLEV